MIFESLLDKYGPGISHLAMKNLKREFDKPNTPISLTDIDGKEYNRYMPGDSARSHEIHQTVKDLYDKGKLIPGKYIQWMETLKEDGFVIDATERSTLNGLCAKLGIKDIF